MIKFDNHLLCDEKAWNDYRYEIQTKESIIFMFANGLTQNWDHQLFSVLASCRQKKHSLVHTKKCIFERNLCNLCVCV